MNEPSYYSEPYYNVPSNSFRYTNNPMYNSANNPNPVKEHIYAEIPLLEWQPGKEVYNTTTSGPSPSYNRRTRNGYNTMSHLINPPPLPPPRLPPRNKPRNPKIF